MNPLHRSDHAQLAKPGDIIGVQVLRMLDAPPQIFFLRVGFESFLINVQDLAVCSIPDGMDIELKTMLYCYFCRLPDGVDRRGVPPCAGRQVCVGLK